MARDRYSSRPAGEQTGKPDASSGVESRAPAYVADTIAARRIAIAKALQEPLYGLLCRPVRIWAAPEACGTGVLGVFRDETSEFAQDDRLRRVALATLFGSRNKRCRTKGKES